MSLRPPLPQRLDIEGPAGRLEAVLEDPAPPQVSAFAVVCHPHPLHGGTLNNKVVHTLARTLQERAIPTVRFNYRGVGASEGSYDEGRGETDDALAVVEWGRRRWGGAPVWLAGFSFGAMVALQAASAAQPSLMISVAPAVTRAEFGVIAHPRCPWLIVQGDADEIIAADAVLAFASRLVPPPQLRLLAGAGHFFHGRLHELHDIVAAFVDAVSPPGSDLHAQM